MTKTKVAVLRGGPSSEYDVSLKSGTSVLDNLNREKYEPIDIFVDKNGQWYIGGIQKKPEVALANIDVVWNALHGEYGEDGEVQKILDDIGVPYTGSKHLASALSIDKIKTKKTLANSGVKMAQHLELLKNDTKSLNEIFRVTPNPSVVKPVSLGSSIGVTIVRDFFDLQNALEKAFAVTDQIMIEEYIDGREATCGVIENFRGKDLYALPVTEIIPAPEHDFFDYEAKYGGGSKEICPSNFSDDTKGELERLAVLVHKTLGLSHYSRSDFIVHPKRGIYFLEVNTLPGLTKESLIPKAIEAVGSSLPEFLDHVITIAINEK